jgi:hypothetical protein
VGRLIKPENRQVFYLRITGAYSSYARLSLNNLTMPAHGKAGLQLTHDPRYRCTIGWFFTIVKASIVSPVMVLK